MKRTGPDFFGRQRSLFRLMERKKLESVLVTDPHDIYYYTGYEPSSDASLIFQTKSKPRLFVSMLDNESEGLKTAEVSFSKKKGQILKILKNYKKLGYDENHLNAYVFSRLEKSKINLKPSSELIKEPRLVKDEWEIEQIRKAVKITENVLKNVKNKMTGKSEIDVAKEVSIQFSKNFVDNAFETIVASGTNSSFVHHKPGKRVIRKNDLIIVDLGARYNGYCSDMTRTFCSNPGKRERGIYQNVLEIQEKIIDRVRNGVELEKLQKTHESLLKKKGYKQFHSFGHSVGLSVHEQIPKILKKNMVITVEPGIYIKNFGGCRIEDMILIKKNKAEILPAFPKDLY